MSWYETRQDPVALTAWLVDTPSVSGSEGALADGIATGLAATELDVRRDGNAVVASTHLDRARRVLLAGHLDTVPIADNVPSTSDGRRIHGCGSSDMKSGVAVMLHLAATLGEPGCDVTYVFYDNEEVGAASNGLGRLARDHRDWLAADLALLLEPTNGAVEAGCQGTLRVRLDATGRRAHSARSWLGDDAIHRLTPALQALAGYRPRQVTIDGCTYREGLNAVAVSGGVAGNVIPDAASLTVNFRFAPDRSEQQALDHVHQVFAASELSVTMTDSSPGALPGVSQPAAADFIAAIGATPVAKYGWTDVARFAALGLPALNYGPGDPNLAHTREESVDIAAITSCAVALGDYLG